MKTNRFIIATVLLLLCTLYAGAADYFKVDGLYYWVISGTDNVMIVSPGYPDTYEGAVTIPATVEWEGKLYQVTRISSWVIEVLSGNTKLTSITVDNDNLLFSSSGGVLFDKDKTRLILYPAGKPATTCIVPNTVKIIGEYAFYKNIILTSIVLPEGLKKIGDHAFHSSRIESIITSEGLEKIGPYTFYDAGITSVILPKGLKTIGPYTFSDAGIKSAILPEGLETIGRYAFHGVKIESVILPNTLKEIGYAAFESSYIKSITIPASVESVDDWAFTKCPQLRSIVFEGPVQSVGRVVFAGYYDSPRPYTMEVKCKPFQIANSLDYVDLENSILIVPDGMKGLFPAAPGWKNFGIIIEKSEVPDEAPDKETPF